MFEHLDDTTEPSPGVGELASVLRRARSIRTRRSVATVTAVCVILAAVLGGFAVSRTSNTKITSVETAYAFDTFKGPLEIGTAVPTPALLTTVFANGQDGFALAAHRGTALLAITTDGGDAWQVQNDSLPAGYGQSDGFPGQIEFIGTHGYLWGGAPEPNGSMPLWVSDDRGSTWTQAFVGPNVFDVSAIGANVWALIGNLTLRYRGRARCRLSNPTTGDPRGSRPPDLDLQRQTVRSVHDLSNSHASRYPTHMF